MRWNTQSIKDAECLKNNKLYEVTKDHPTVTIVETHEDSEPEIVDLEFCIPPEGRGIAAKEYRNKDFSSSKAADILCILLDPAKKEVSSYIYDIKRTMTGFDESKTLEELRKSVVKRIQDFILQLQDSVIHKDSLTVQYIRYENYSEALELGLITREFDDLKLTCLSERLMAGLYETEKDMGVISKKYYIASQPLRKEINMVNNFRDKKIEILGRIICFSVFLLTYEEEKQGYYKKIMIG